MESEFTETKAFVRSFVKQIAAIALRAAALSAQPMSRPLP